MNFCPECGEKVPDEGSTCCAYCGRCFVHLETEEDPALKSGTEKNISGNVLVIGILIVMTVIITAASGLLLLSNVSSEDIGTPALNVSAESVPPSSIVPVSQITGGNGLGNVQKAAEIVENYHTTHTYYGENIFSCGDMACDIWDQLQTAGINANIIIGHVGSDTYNITGCDHAWIVAGVEPDRWLAFETTGGFPVTDNSSYYRGYRFNNPKSFRDFEQLVAEYNDALSKYKAATNDYNQFVPQYNDANILAKIGMKDELITKAKIMQQRQADVEETIDEMATIVKNQ